MEAYKRSLRGHRPNTWAVHPYEDANRFQARGVRSTPATDFILRHLRGSFATGDDGRRSEIWLSAIGVFWRNAALRVFGDASQRDAMAFVMRMATQSDLGRTGRLTRLYIYNFQNPCCPNQDRGLVAPPAQPGTAAYDRPHRIREAFFKVCNRDGRPGPRAATCPAVAAAPTPPGAAPRPPA
ncbi:MAG: hypothetical protein M3296_02705, partial [Actinomycetota bacterium]|nr:hypothetical protein [Actinomycetota bacterium]